MFESSVHRLWARWPTDIEVGQNVAFFKVRPSMATSVNTTGNACADRRDQPLQEVATLAAVGPWKTAIIPPGRRTRWRCRQRVKDVPHAGRLA